MFIKFEKFHKKHLLLIVFPFFKIIENYLEKNIDLNNLFISPFLISISQILCIVFWLSRIQLNKRKNTIIKEKENKSLHESLIKDNVSLKSIKLSKKENRGLSQVEIVFDENYKKQKIKSIKEIFFFFVLSIICFFSTLLKVFFPIYIIKNKFNLIITTFFILILRFLLMAILGRYILKEPYEFYKHKIITLILISIISISYFCYYLKYNNENIIIIICLLFIIEILNSIFYIGGKEYMQFAYKSPFKLLFFIGVICFLFLSIFYIIFISYGKGSNLWSFFINYLTTFKKDYDDDYYINLLIFFSELELSSIFCLILKLLLLVINNYFEWQILSFFSVNHFSSSYMLYVCILPLFFSEDMNFIIFYLLFFIIVFLLLIFNEIIILYCFSLEKNTFHEKKIREMSDFGEERGTTDNDLNEEDINNNNANNSNTEIELNIDDIS